MKGKFGPIVFGSVLLQDDPEVSDAVNYDSDIDFSSVGLRGPAIERP